jgi:hypothetical protein
MAATAPVRVRAGAALLFGDDGAFDGATHVAREGASLGNIPGSGPRSEILALLTYDNTKINNRKSKKSSFGRPTPVDRVAAHTTWRCRDSD